LTGSAAQECLGEYRELPPDDERSGEIAVAHAGADPNPVGRQVDAIQSKPGDVDQQLRCFDAQFHEVDQVGPAGEKDGRGGPRHGSDGLGHV
jgi:hypothetical protein